MLHLMIFEIGFVYFRKYN